MTDADKVMNPQHFGRDPAGIRIRSNPAIRIGILDCFWLKFWRWRRFALSEHSLFLVISSLFGLSPIVLSILKLLFSQCLLLLISLIMASMSCAEVVKGARHLRVDGDDCLLRSLCGVTYDVVKIVASSLAAAASSARRRGTAVVARRSCDSSCSP